MNVLVLDPFPIWLTTHATWIVLAVRRTVIDAVWKEKEKQSILQQHPDTATDQNPSKAENRKRKKNRPTLTTL
jgi:hypothetical protein